MKKGKVKDLVVATKEETISTILTSDSFSEFAGALAESVVSEGVAGIVGEVAGAVIPGINSIRLSYKQKRFEYRVKKAFSSELSDSWLEMYTINTEAFIVSYLPLLSSILPMENLLISKMENGRLSIYSQKSGLLISLIIENGLISAIGTDSI
jgi:sporulation protein YlmC with PRC-barrel domain